MNKNSLLRRHTQFTDQTVWTNGLPPIERRPDFWAKALSEFMDVLAFLAIYLTSEVQLWPFIVVGFFACIRIFTSNRLRALWIVTGYILQIFLGVLLILRVPLHPLVAAAHIAPLAMAWIGLAKGSSDFWGARMGLGFIGLILASALSPDFIVMIFILGFIVSGSIGLSCRFLSAEFVRRGITGSLPPGFIRRSFYQSGILLLSALIIFPMIPRVSGKNGGVFGGDTTQTGYTEDINLNEWVRVSNQGSSATALRIYGPNGGDPASFIPGGLLRSRVLNILDSNRWNAAPLKLNHSLELENQNSDSTLMIVREMIGTPNLPTPYGTRSITVELDGDHWDAEKTFVGEWREARSRNLRFKYFVTTSSDGPKAPQDVPTAVELVVPNEFITPRLKALAENLFKNTRTPEAKISAVQAFFQREKFTATYAEESEPLNDDKKTPPIERFLFNEKTGHCELFSSAMAILLRMGGVPTRLIAGFRVTRNAYGDVLTVRQSDAHAWLEAFIPKHGWSVFDPTPRVLHSPNVSDWFRDMYDWASAKWTQYILNYGEGENSLYAQWRKLKKIVKKISTGENPIQAGDRDANVYLFSVIFLVGASILSMIAVFVFRKIRKALRTTGEDQIKIELRKERLKVETIRLKTKGHHSEKIENWFNLYERARFRDISKLDRASLFEIRQKRREIETLILKK